MQKAQGIYWARDKIFGIGMYDRGDNWTQNQALPSYYDQQYKNQQRTELKCDTNHTISTVGGMAGFVR